ncbi:alpha/beta-hydrolase [Microthyrium microscopicum]|uniref:Alpha/beta-hydrolase n=1 Tax=Microthyrium microscopicum TaxID=703497 RepID=A0A6A6U4F8_9PEZI|nr:alpha/beta-hydrolase [Microthyrium microscopicum]
MTSSESNQQSPLASQREQANSQSRAYFPLGYKEAFGQWWAGVSPAETEHKVLSFVPRLQRPDLDIKDSKCRNREGVKSDTDSIASAASTDDPFGARKWFINLVKLSGKDRALNEFSVERVGEQVDNDLVMLHGYGAGLGFFYKNFEALSRLVGWKVYALDLLGMGRSSRPSFKIHAKDHEGKIREAENWFIDALEEWRIKRNIEKFTLLGHSMGGYMAVAYALKYPGRLKKLILVSPVGIPEDPYAVKAELPNPDTSTMQAEALQDQESIANGEEAPAPRRRIPKWVEYLWDANVSPFSVVRLVGPLGPSLVSGWTTRRFSHLPPKEAQALHDYSYSLFRQRGSGEYALAYILAPGAFARSPLIHRIQGVGRQVLAPHAAPTVDDVASQASAARESGIPVVMMYGDHDWMDVDGGRNAERKILEEKSKALEGKSADEWKKDQGDAKVVIVKNAGHHLYLDGYDEFNEIMIDELKDVEKRERASRS